MYKFSDEMKSFAALALVTLFCCLEVALAYPRHPMRQQQNYNTLQQDTATAQQRGLLKMLLFHHDFVSFMQVLYVAMLITVNNPSLEQTQLKGAATFFEQSLIMILLPMNAKSAPNLDVCEDHIPSNETA